MKSIEQLDKSIIKETKHERIIRLTGFDSTLCPKCMKGRMIIIEEIPRIRSPDTNLPVLLLSKLNS